MSNWSGELIDTTQPAPFNTDTNQDREDIQDNPLPSNCTDQDNFWLGKTYVHARDQWTLKPAPPNPPSKGDEDSEWSKLPCRSHLPNLFQDGLKASELIPPPK